MHERRYRRRGWTLGARIVLPDESVWYLPELDFTLMATTSRLQRRMAEVFYLARETRDETDEAQHRLINVLYHTKMAILAVALLQINYDLTESQWEQLTGFGDQEELVAISEQTSAIFFDTSEVWMPFLTTSGPENREVLLLN